MFSSSNRTKRPVQLCLAVHDRFSQEFVAKNFFSGDFPRKKMEAFSSFFDSNSKSGSRNQWSYDSLRNFHQISPHVQAHLQQVSRILSAHDLSRSLDSVCLPRKYGMKDERFLHLPRELLGFWLTFILIHRIDRLLVL